MSRKPGVRDEPQPLGIRPKFLPKLEMHGVRLPPTLFGGERRLAS